MATPRRLAGVRVARSSRPLALGLLFVLLAVGLLAGCGAPPKPPLSKSAYVKAFKAAHTKTLRSLRGHGRPSPARSRAALRALRTQLGALRPPAEVQHAHEQYLGGLDALGRSSSPGAARQNAGPLLLSAQDEFVQQGYDFTELLDPRLLEGLR